MKFTNSPLVDYTKISPNKTSPRNHEIDTITIHCYVGQAQVESMGEWLGNPNAKASSNYGIGTDGRIALLVEEKDRSWCSSNADNDNRAITIECASDKKAPFAVNDKVYASLINLIVDICKRNDIKELRWRGDKSLIGQIDKQNMTVHKWFKNKDCPGEYLYSRHGKIAAEVNARLNGGQVSEEVPVTKPEEVTNFPKVPFEVDVLIDDLNYRSEPSMNGTVEGQTGTGSFTIVEVSNGWGKLKSEAGWIWLGNPSYLTINDAVKNDNDGTFKVKVTADKLNVRRGPGTNYGVDRAVNKNDVYTITGMSGDWGRLKSGAGWINLKYTKKSKEKFKMISFRQKGDFAKLTRYFEKIKGSAKLGVLDKYGKAGVDALSSATPVDSGLTAASWSYKIEHTKNSASIAFVNSNINNGVPIAIILQYGHGTGTGGWVQGRDYINPAIQPIFDNIANDAWREVTKV